MEEFEDKLCLDELKAHYKNFSKEGIDALYEANNRDISKTIEALIESQKYFNINNNEKNEKFKNVENIRNKDITHLANFEVVDKNEYLEEEKTENKINEEFIENNNFHKNDFGKDEIVEPDEEIIDDFLLDFLIEILPFNTEDEIKKKVYDFNFDIDKVVSVLTNETENNSQQNQIDDSPNFGLKFLLNSKNKFYRINDNKNKGNKRYNKNNNKNKKSINYKNFNKDEIDKFLMENGNSKTINLHGKTLPESMYIIRKKLEYFEEKIIEDNIKEGIVLRIITGKGIHSPGHIPVLYPKLTVWLKNMKKYIVDEKSEEGTILVTIKYIS